MVSDDDDLELGHNPMTDAEYEAAQKRPFQEDGELAALAARQLSDRELNINRIKAHGAWKSGMHLWSDERIAILADHLDEEGL